MKNASQKTNIEEAIKRSTAAAKNARNVKRAQNIQSTKNRAREEAELKAKINIEKSKANAKREAVAEALGYETYEYGEAIVEQGDDGDEVSCAYLAALFPR